MSALPAQSFVVAPPAAAESGEPLLDPPEARGVSSLKLGGRGSFPAVILEDPAEYDPAVDSLVSWEFAVSEARRRHLAGEPPLRFFEPGHG